MVYICYYLLSIYHRLLLACHICQPWQTRVTALSESGSSDFRENRWLCHVDVRSLAVVQKISKLQVTRISSTSPHYKTAQPRLSCHMDINHDTRRHRPYTCPSTHTCPSLRSPPHEDVAHPCKHALSLYTFSTLSCPLNILRFLHSNAKHNTRHSF